MVLYIWIFYICTIGSYAATNNVSSFQNHPIKIMENETTLLPCNVENQDAEKPRVKWWREGNLLVDSYDQKLSNDKVTLYGNGSLQIRNVQQEDSGQYVCQTIRPIPWGYVTQVHEIEVMYPSSVKTVPESGQLEVNFGETVDMQCVAEGVPSPVITWMTKDEVIPLLDARPQLRFHADNRNLSGKYTCIADNKIGDPAMAHIDLRIRYKPEIYAEKQWVHAYPGIRVQLTCRVIAWPEAKVEWYLKNKTLTYTSRIVKHNVGSDHNLLIRVVQSSDYGSYRCKASNSLGTTEKNIELSGIANPAVFKKAGLREEDGTSRTSYNFIWQVDSYSPVIEYQFWFRKYKRGNGGEWRKLFIPGNNDNWYIPGISSVHVRSFNLTGLDAATHYEAVVLSRNHYGWSHPSEIVRFHTEGALVDSSENFETNDGQEQDKLPVISMTKPHLLKADANRSMYNQARALLLILNTLCTLIITFNNRF
ncbi:neurotrimin-like [Linepithema humile]|uniref:neurotrimin-like n=1 Tax=Linepithema humile TaxID=83485 RepID=UPI0006239484|nr:PREDICTED: neurotrimin-like [Linepithema humile]